MASGGRHPSSWPFAPVLGVVLLGCSNEVPSLRRLPPQLPSSPSAAGQSQQAQPKTFSFATFNAGLAPSVGQRAERAPRIEAELAKLEADVLCLQEVWGEAAQARASEVLSGRGMHVLKGPQREAVAHASCSPVEVRDIQACLERNCQAKGDSVECAYAHCSAVVARLSTQCTSCLAHDPDQTPSAALRACTAGRKTADSVYQGGTGLLLALREEPAVRSTTLLPSAIVARGIVHARLGQSRLDVYCTHLASRGEYPSPSAWREISERQVEALHREVETKSGSGAAVVLGDLNFTVAEISLFAPLRRAGFISAYAMEDGRCTYCGGGGSGQVIDHVLTRPPLRVTSVARVLDGPGLSDHFGVRVDARY